MRDKKILLLVLFSSLALLGFAARVTPGQMIIKTSQPVDPKSDRTGLIEFDSYLDQLGASNLRPIQGMHTPRYYLVDVAEEPDWEDLRGGDISFPGIEYIQPNGLSSFHMEPNDPLYGQQFHSVTHNPEAWNYTTGSPTVVVGVIDSGCLIDHPDLQGNIWVNPGEIPDNGIDDDGNGYIDDWCGWDFADAPELSDTAVGDYTEQDNDVEDENFHGTHVSGIVGAVGNNSVGVAGVAWNVSIMPIRAGFRTTTGQGYLQDDDAAAAIIYAADNGCNVVNMSWGDPDYSPIIGDACYYAYSKGVTLIASAGNDPGPYLSYPAKLSTVISVGAVNRNNTIAGFSSYGMDMDLVAPGEMVLSTYKLDAGQQYFEQSGTSMSSPFVVGAAALLLSLHPGLSPDEVRGSLCNSTDDLGVSGFDQYYGHGLLNTRKLLENTAPPLVCVDEPLEQSGVRNSFAITGSVDGNDMFRYSVMYTDVDIPTILDWFDVETHHNYPTFHTQPVHDDTLAYFYIPESFPEGDYTLRVQYENNRGRKFNYYRSITYDRTLPELVEESLQGFSRYDKQNLRHYISAIFSEDVRTQLMVTDPFGTVHSCYGTRMDSLHVWRLPDNLPQGEVDIKIKATNVSGLTLTTDIYPDFWDIQYDVVPSHGYEWKELGFARVPLNYMYDYDGDGNDEYIAMDLPSTGYGQVHIYQPAAAGHEVKHSYNESFWLLGAGNTNDEGQEILQLKGDTAILLESQLTSTYPHIPLWEDTSITGGVIADYSNDGQDDILLVKNLPAQRVIQAYKRSGNQILPKNVLYNTSETNVRNTFVPTITVENLDNDSFKDILTADTDGDIMIYEIRNDNLEELVWSYRMSIGNTYSIATGDFDGNGTRDFIVGGYLTDILDTNLNFWLFEGFRNVSNNNYVSMGTIMFNDVASQNAVRAMDLDNDGKDEIILAIAPNLYVLKYEAGQFKPQFYGNSFRTYSILAYKDQNNRPYFLTNYSVDADSVFAVEWTSSDPFTGPATPMNFLASPQDEESVNLTWISSGADHYNIYRREADGSPELIGTSSGNSYTDFGLVPGTTYEYSISGYDAAYDPSESMPTIWQSVVPDWIPHVTGIAMVSKNQLRVNFSQPMSNVIINPTLYSVDHAMGSPTSVNSVESNRGVQLQFNNSFPATDEEFVLTMSSIENENGVPLQGSHFVFVYSEDTTAPRILEVEVLPGQKSLDILFNEEIAPENPDPEMLINYTLICHSNDTDNEILAAEHLGDRIRITLGHKLKFGSSPYLVTIRNIRDLAGNTISPQNNVARFTLVNNHNLDNLIVYPNPVRGGDNQCRFLNFPAGQKGSVRLYDSSGALVRTATIQPFDSQIDTIHKWDWDMKNNAGARVSSGVYFYVIEMGGDLGRGKIAVIN